MNPDNPAAACKRRTNLAGHLAVLAALAACGTAYGQWPQWGGPDRNFKVETSGLADSWPAEGPPRLWDRELGDGYSAVLVDDGLLYTMYWADNTEFIVALDAKSGKTIWEHEYPTKFAGTEYGPGPHATPLVAGDKLITVGATVAVHCLDKTTGKVLWKRDLAADYGAPVPHFGYACSPILYKNTVILPVDRERPRERGGAETKTEKSATEGQSLMALDLANGRLVWKAQDFPIDYSSPILIELGGRDQLVLIMRKDVAGIDPNDGRLLWHHPVDPSAMENIATPVWNGRDLLFLSAAYNSGSRVIKLTQQNGKTIPEELWYSRKMRIHMGNAVLLGDHVYGSSGDFGSILFACTDLQTGKVAWRTRGFKKANCVHGDGKLILLDEDGVLALTTVSPKGWTVHSQCKVTENQSWTAPTLVGKTLYVRDRKRIMALDLG